MIRLNLYFWKIHLLKWSSANNGKFGMMRDGNDFCISWKSYELYIIPRYSVSFSE